ncbi:lipocalin family protein [Sphingomicrobium sediminis]|uniref:Outer membrane lipoprotein Blc n=1 Tax=Sphingomicrobium sediminis TaxID=2950949 RepID=A0A9X2J3F3_9SPHN|nr:lipocalin family protein [Sphingomicrobium sediminis]MCM8557995.1 lipocalin family protein [Sphingomicrobium sediminis]
MRLILPLSLVLALSLSACSTIGRPVGNPSVPLPAQAVEVEAYLGTWYEYGRYEAPFQEGCEAVTATYSLEDDGDIRVVNACTRDGERDESEGEAKIVDGSANTRLKVAFFKPFYGDYWILDHGLQGADGLYDWSIVGEPSGTYLWMLTRQAKPDADLAMMLEARVKELGYDWSMVRLTRH